MMLSNDRNPWIKTLLLISAVGIVFSLQGEAVADTALKPKQFSSFKQMKRMLSSKKLRANREQEIKAISLPTAAADSGLAVAAGGGLDYSQTNVQVNGVDEGDGVKTDGQFIYRIHNGQVVIVRATPADKLETISSLSFDNAFNPIELYLQGDTLVVLGSGWHAGSGDSEQSSGQAKVAIWAISGESRTIAKVYNLADRANPQLQREVAFSGDYLSSRKIDNRVYLIGRKYPNYFLSYYADSQLKAQKQNITKDNTLPKISDSTVADGKEQALPIDDLYYFPGFVEPDYVIVASFDLSAPNQEANIQAYLGSGDITYASKDNLYLSAADYSATEAAASSPVTHLYKFALNQGAIAFSHAAEVPGTVLNSFSMDEHGGYFRIATTVDQWNNTDGNVTSQTWNNLYTLDADMNIAGRLEHLAEGERIYSARFIGNRGYLVTFEQTDPLFVIDLSQPAAPQLLGELKIPGFSNYLHPFDETHLLGFGQDTEVVDDRVVTKGMKIALFDVGDASKPTQLHSLTLGAEGTSSPLMWDHKALWTDAQRGLIGFPINETAGYKNDGSVADGFDGAYVYKVSVSGGFEKQATLTHQDSAAYDWSRTIQRLLSIGDQLYTLSETRIQANNLADFSRTGVLDFPLEASSGCTLPVVSGVADAMVGDCRVLITDGQTGIAESKPVR